MTDQELQPKPLSMSELGRIEEQLLKARLDAVRAALRHSGEKGRALEHQAASFLRSFLPAEYGISGGFVAYHGSHGVKLSKQLDIIIYDAVRGGPLARLETCDVFPVEAVYAYVEVKASLASSEGDHGGDSIEKCIEDNATLRLLKERQFWAVEFGSPGGLTLATYDELALRGYVFAFEGRGRVAGEIDSLAKRIGAVSKAHSPQAHLHGVFVADVGFAYTVPSDPDREDPADTHHMRFTSQHALLTFKAVMLRQLATFWRAPPEYSIAFDRYYDYLPDWEDFSPSTYRDASD